MQYSTLRRSESTIWLRSDSYARLNHHCLLGTFRCSTCGRMCQSRIGLFSHNRSIARDGETRRIDGSVRKQQTARPVLRPAPSSPTPSNGIECIYTSAQHIQSVMRLLNTLRRSIGLSTQVYYIFIIIQVGKVSRKSLK